MTATTLPRLPREMTVGGSSVAVRMPFASGSVAHRPKTVQREVAIPTSRWGATRNAQIPVSACAPDDDECGLLTAAWADHLGAQACTEDACFPDAVSR